MFGAREIAIISNSDAWHNGHMKAEAITAYLEYIKELEKDIRDICKGLSDRPLIFAVAELIEACAELSSGAEANGGGRLKTARKHAEKALKLIDKYRNRLEKFYSDTADETGPFWHRREKNREQEMKDLLRRVQILLGE
jgi:cell division septum initiation protein DivIVA